MEPPPPSYEEVVEGKSDAVLPPPTSSSFQRDKERLELAKKQAVEEEDYERAKELKLELDNLIKQSGQILVLEEKKRKAVADEDYALAQEIKKDIEALKAGRHGSEVICYELGQGAGFLLHVKVSSHSSALSSAVAPTPVIVLDRSLSMKGSCRWAITMAVPSALTQLGYADTTRCVLLTFDSVVERVQINGRDPMLKDLWTIDVSARGKTTMLAQVFAQLRLLIKPLQAYNVFVISDGFVHDIQHVRPCVRDVTQQGLTSGSRVSFALFRFFNGAPPDTAALAAVASIGNDGGSPCMDCIPPMEWQCARGHATSFRKTSCDSCSMSLNRNNVGINGQEPLEQFCLTAKQAFSVSLQPHCRIRCDSSNSGKRAMLMRVPFLANKAAMAATTATTTTVTTTTSSLSCLPSSAFSSDSSSSASLAAESGVELPCGQEVLLALSDPITTVLVGESKMSVSVYQGLPSDERIAGFCAEALAQLRLWAVGGVRKKHFSEAIEWFRRFSRLRASAGKAEGNHVVLRAWTVRKNVEESESALGRICSLGDADSFVSKLNSKQQGDFLRGASVARSERLLARRALGSDIFFHDAVRTVLAALTSVDTMQNFAPTTTASTTDNHNNTSSNNNSPLTIHSRVQATAAETKEEQACVSYYGGGTYNDIMTAAQVLSRFTEDLLTCDILEVVGGLGVAFCFGSSGSSSENLSGSSSNSGVSEKVSMSSGGGSESKSEGEHKRSAVVAAALVDSVWEWEMSAVESGGYVSEADVWAAKANGEPLRLAGELVHGVIPLSICDSASHASYYKLLAPLALMHIGAQLHCSPAREVWSWDPAHPPYALEEGAGAREAAALRCLLSKSVGTSKVPSASESSLIFALLSQFQERMSLLENNEYIKNTFLSWTQPSASAASSSSSPSSVLLAFAVTCWYFLNETKHNNNNITNFDSMWARKLYCLEIEEQAKKKNLVSTVSSTPQQSARRSELLVNLLCDNPTAQRMELTEERINEAVQQRMNGEDIGSDVVIGEAHVRLADVSIIIQRLHVVVPVLPPPLLAFGLYRVLEARKAASELNPATDCLRMLPTHQAEHIWFGTKASSSSSYTYDLFPLLVIATKLCTQPQQQQQQQASSSLFALVENISTQQQMVKELQKILNISIKNDYIQRLALAVSSRLQAKRLALEKTLEFKSSGSGGDVRLSLDYLIAICNTVKGTQTIPSEPFKPRLSVVLCGDCNSGKSSLVGRVLLEMGRLGSREVTKLYEEARAIGKSSYVLAHSMDRLKCERERGISIILKKTWISTTRYFTTLLDTPGHRDYTGNMLRGIAQGDVGVLVVPADNRFENAVAKANPHLGEKQGALRAHAHFLNTSGIKQLIILLNKMDCVDYSERRFSSCCEEIKICLRATGWGVGGSGSGSSGSGSSSSSFIPLVIPVSGIYGENVIHPSTKMPWWRGQQVSLADGSIGTIVTFLDALNEYVLAPPRETQKPFRLCVSNVFKIKGVGDVLTGRVEQGSIKPNTRVKVMGRTKHIPCNVVSLETHHTAVHEAYAGDIIGVKVKELVRDNMPEVGDVMVLEEEKKLSVVQVFTAQVLVEHYGHIAVGYAPLCVVRTAKHSVKVKEILWKKSSVSGEKMEKPPHLTRGDYAEVVFEAAGMLVVETFVSCKTLSSVIFLDGSECVMIGKVVNTSPTSLLPPPSAKQVVGRR